MYITRITKLYKTTLRNVAKGKYLEEITRALSGTAAALLRARLTERTVQGLSYEVKTMLVGTAKCLISIRKKITSSGMDTILTDVEVKLLTNLVYDHQEPKVHRLSDLIDDKRDLDCLLYRIRVQIELNLEDAESFDREHWETGVDEGVIADFERLDAIKLCLLRNAIFKDGINTLLSADSIDLINRILSSSNTVLRRNEFQCRAIGLSEQYEFLRKQQWNNQKNVDVCTPQEFREII